MPSDSPSGFDLNQVLPELYDDLRRIAAQHLRHEARTHSLQPTDLAHEAYLRLSRQHQVAWHERSATLSAAAGMIRRILIDHARAKQVAKRGGGSLRVPLDSVGAASGTEVDLLVLNDALEALRDLAERQARIVELRFFGGLSIDEAADVLGVSPRTVDNDWRVARAWLHHRLRAEATDAD